MRTPALTLLGAALTAIVVCWTAPAAAHYTVTSKYTWKRDVRPIVEARCGGCHVTGGLASNLLSYEAAKEKAWPIRQALMSGRMPPWSAEGVPVPFKGAQTLTARELNILMVWTAGGTPLGTAPAHASRPTRRTEWPRGAPQAIVAMPEAFTLADGSDRAEQAVPLPADALRGQWIRAADVAPGTSSMVRRAEVDLESAAGTQTLTRWVPGDRPQDLEANAAFRVPPDARLTLRLLYVRPAGARGAMTDRSRVGVYVSQSATPVQVSSVMLEGAGEFPWGSDRVFTQALDRDVRLVAVRPVGGPADATVRLAVLAPDGTRTPLATLVLRPDWQRRYVFASAIPIAAGHRLEARVTPSSGFIWSTLTGDRNVGPSDGGPLRLAFEVTGFSSDSY
jgi:hypothetical protein